MYISAFIYYIWNLWIVCNGFEFRGIFLDISTAFDKIWRIGLIFKWKQNGVTDDLLNILIDFLKERKQRVFLNDQDSKLSNISAGFPQRSVLGPLLFLIYINNLSDNLISTLNSLLMTFHFFRLCMI